MRPLIGGITLQLEDVVLCFKVDLEVCLSPDMREQISPISHHSQNCHQQQQRHIARLECLRPSIEVLAKSDKVPRHMTENPVFVVWSKSTVKQLVEWPL